MAMIEYQVIRTSQFLNPDKELDQSESGIIFNVASEREAWVLHTNISSINPEQTYVVERVETSRTRLKKPPKVWEKDKTYSAIGEASKWKCVHVFNPSSVAFVGTALLVKDDTASIRRVALEDRKHYTEA